MSAAVRPRPAPRESAGPSRRLVSQRLSGAATADSESRCRSSCLPHRGDRVVGHVPPFPAPPVLVPAGRSVHGARRAGSDGLVSLCPLRQLTNIAIVNRFTPSYPSVTLV